MEGNVVGRFKHVTETFIDEGLEETSNANPLISPYLDEKTELNQINPTVVEDDDISPFALLPDSNQPAGYKTGAFNRITTPANTSAYTGTITTSLILPSFAAATGASNGEAASIYTGIGSYLEAGFTTYSGNAGTGWFPYFRVEKPHTDNTGSGHSNSTRGYYYDFNHPYSAGDVISNYKVYYKTATSSESTLKVRFLIGATTFYDITVTDHTTVNVSVKRCTTIGMNNAATPTTKFKTPFTSYAKWFDFKFLKNDGSATVYPTAVTGLIDETWSHGGNIDYIKSGTAPVSKSFKIY